MRRRWLRLLLAAALLVLAALQIDGLVRTLHGEARVREQALRVAREMVLARRDAVADALAPGGEAAYRAAAVLVPIEIFDEGRHLLFAAPEPAPIAHWPTAADLQDLRQGAALTWGPFDDGDPVETATYLLLKAGGQPVVVRVVLPAPGLREEEAAQRRAAMANGVALALILILAALIFRPLPAEDGPGGAMRAYEEAMGRLQAHGARVSQEHEAERQRLRSELDDKDAMARAGELTAGIVHEVRNGLATVVGYARIVERSAAPPEAQDAARAIREECATLETVVRRFVDFVKSETLHLASFDLSRMLTRVAAREGRTRAGVTLVLPEPMPEEAVVGDEEMLERAFENLIRNACQAAGDGGHVWVDVHREDGDVLVRVADDGPGLSAERRAVIRPFTTSKGGLGLGLPMALKIIRLHGGELSLDDYTPHGLLVTVRLPAAGPEGDGSQA